jgi:hypothetical protein
MIGTWYLSRQPEVVAMSVEVPAGGGQQPEFPQMAESKGWSAPGVRILVTGVVLRSEQAQQVVNAGSLYR